MSAMNLVTQVCAMVAVLFHVVAFVVESFLFHRPTVQTFLLGKPEPAAGVRLWAFNQGFYNLFLAIGAIGGAIAGIVGSSGAVCMAMTEECLRGAVQVEWVGIAGGAVAAFSAACMVGAALVLAISGGRASLRSAAMQGTLPVLGLILLAIGAAVV